MSSWSAASRVEMGQDIYTGAGAKVASSLAYTSVCRGFNSLPAELAAF